MYGTTASSNPNVQHSANISPNPELKQFLNSLKLHQWGKYY